MTHKLHPRLQEFVADKWRGGLTEIQQQAFDPIYNRQDCVIEAPTAGGKTEAVLFPLLSRIARNKNTGIKVLYIAPLKALLNDLAIRVCDYSKKCYLEAFKWHGDVSQTDKIKQMLFPSDILLTTPESLEAILLRRANWTDVFASLETIVIDEAHYFALTERGSHLVSLMERLTYPLDHPVQRIAITATIGNPEELMDWLQPHRKGIAIKVVTKKQKEKNFQIKFFKNDGEGMDVAVYNELVKHKSIVFSRSRTFTEELAGKLNQINELQGNKYPFKVRTHHSSVSKFMREEAERLIKIDKGEGDLNAIISTSTLELGIDIGELDKVIQIEGLASAGSFLQRVGRTGRREGKPQYFLGFCSDEQDLLLLIASVNLGLKGISENVLFPKKAFHILAHQIICLTLQKQGITPDKSWEILKNAYCFSSISRSEFDELIANMIQTDYLRKVGADLLVTGDQTEAEFLKMNYRRLFAIFDSGPMYEVVNGKNVIGTLDIAFAKTLTAPFVFILGGKEWQAKEIDHEMQRIKAVENKSGIAPKWVTYHGSDVPYEVAQEVGRILHSQEELYFLDRDAKLVLKHFRNSVSDIGWQPGTWVIQDSEEGLNTILWTYCGDKINRAIAKMALVLEGVELRVTYQYLSLEKENNREYFDWQQFIEKLKTLTEEEMTNLTKNHVKASWFSKFSNCLSEDIARKTIIERSMDYQGLFIKLNKINNYG
ncbi:DEAD/DEAH box helicase [Flavihumibacter cheonanensis]|uniref:DEAD/DEAH box helicase n=1 Tax=Flavihumibacter cheonanensis TaxID=1442385 RepID=UPI001EF89AD7|nr:DEAD/DEAH box helicase [Flavihumibacter cheonanensis]MCG7753481.1 DEAD/DEAH box helicase [Flavihumibacter cheonanensis]